MLRATPRFALFLGIASLALGANFAFAEDLTIFAAASTKDAVSEIAKQFTARSGVEVEVIPGPSSGLAKQIEQGASADLFLSADLPNMDYLDKKGLIQQRRDLLGNRLVIVVPASDAVDVRDIAGLAKPEVKRVALAAEKVPAGEYARQALKKAGVWESIQAKTVGGVDVRATLQYVARGEVEAGIVYATDARGTSQVRVAVEVDPTLHAPIIYPLALVKRPTPNPAAAKLFEFMTSDAAAKVFREAGFTVLAPK